MPPAPSIFVNICFIGTRSHPIVCYGCFLNPAAEDSSCDRDEKLTPGEKWLVQVSRWGHYIVRPSPRAWNAF